MTKIFKWPLVLVMKLFNICKTQYFHKPVQHVGASLHYGVLQIVTNLI